MKDIIDMLKSIGFGASVIALFVSLTALLQLLSIVLAGKGMSVGCMVSFVIASLATEFILFARFASDEPQERHWEFFQWKNQMMFPVVSILIVTTGGLFYRYYPPAGRGDLEFIYVMFAIFYTVFLPLCYVVGGFLLDRRNRHNEFCLRKAKEALRD